MNMLTWDEPQQNSASPAQGALAERSLQSMGGTSASPQSASATAPALAVAADLYSQRAASTARVRAEDKRIINCSVDVNQLVPSNTNGPGTNTSLPAPITGCRRK
jgi:hypothetical protein